MDIGKIVKTTVEPAPIVVSPVIPQTNPVPEREVREPVPIRRT